MDTYQLCFDTQTSSYAVLQELGTEEAFGFETTAVSHGTEEECREWIDCQGFAAGLAVVHEEAKRVRHYAAASYLETITSGSAKE